MTPAQLSTFKAAILADATAAPLFSAGNDTAVAAYYNELGTGFIWRPDLNLTDIANSVVWSDFDNVTAAKKGVFQAMLQTGALDATKSSIRAGFTTVFGGASASTTALTAAAQRTPTKFEALFAVSNVVPVNLYGHTVTPTDVGEARNA